ncbi:MAG TPA: ABC transporter permease [Atribacter sp.]|jgi:ribose/xylose/arabinose/galactoside ABC-type transport system permease subunit|uniref:Ribose transport system permease protein RbsC n=1 Tax=Candidatus Atribacter allofermentans TaxID=1852833 RepID=A0A1V5SIH3_9BACT|nr:ABC transporter permease [Atribacter sp.]MDD3713902.1 ABC transporter permease [Atribacterota bacterium]OQA54346.1 MAG: Ribose transport system permease protein RbsC [Candidatus Atribacteria bacterium ADurb.Bin276]HHT09321.1 ABC transporter permease [Candidatus Atribacteria bacterium]MDI9594512.1 ABC transporter permease [Atribacterota bacterium]HOT04656.1 ABC transporter permease [Atribacter sp.]
MDALTEDKNQGLVERFFIFWDKIGILLVFIVVCVIFGILNPVFFNPLNIINVIRQVSIIGVMAVGMTLVILLGLIDLSVGSIVAFAGIIAAGFQVKWGGSLFLSLVIPLLVGAGIGYFNGYVSTKGGIHPFIVTLGSMSIFRGATLLIAQGKPISGMSPAFRFIGAGMIGPIPFPVILFLGCVIIFGIMLKRTVFGRYIYAIGGNQEAALLSGIMVDRVKILTYTILGTLSGLSALILTSRLNSGELVAGQGYELDVIASVVIGGTSMMGGEGGVYGTLIGALLIGVISNGLNLLGVQPYWQMMVKGTIIILAVLMDRMKRRFRTV